MRRLIFNSFAGLGLKAGGSSISTADFLRPGRLAQVGLDAWHPLPDDGLHQLLCELRPGCGPDGVRAPGPDRLFILAVKLFVTLIEFKLTTLAGVILFPFALFNTAFLAEKVLGNVVASVEVMVLAVIVGIGTGLSRSSPPLWRLPADDRADAFCRARRTRHARPRRRASPQSLLKDECGGPRLLQIKRISTGIFVFLPMVPQWLPYHPTQPSPLMLLIGALVAETRTHAGTVRVRRYAFKMP
ncbi:hypothetical protein ABIB66_008289 [Bradyrhizobium sp. F1.13.3]